MRIGFDAKRLFCNFTGLGNYSRSLLRNLHEFHPGNEYYLYTPEISRNAETEYFADKKAFNTIVPDTSLKSLWRSFTIKNQLKKDNPDLYHGLSHELPFGIKKTGIRTIVTIHDLIFKHYPETYPRTDRFIYNYKFSYSCDVADKIVAISESTKSDIINFYNIPEEKIEVIYQSCNPLFYKLQDQEVNDRICKEYQLPDNYLLYVGSIEARKNLKCLIRSYAALNAGIRMPLVLVGKGGKYKQETHRIVHELGLQKDVIWIDRLHDNRHLQSVYQNAHAMIYPSLFEGFGLPVTEALLCKTPVITSSCSAMPEAGGPDSMYFDPGSHEQLTICLEKVISDTELRTKMITKGYEYAMTTFSPEILSGKMLRLYQNISGKI
jgi:glycosyltransferase involved in cell wall biosynthesis